jgi:hypothetical protein
MKVTRTGVTFELTDDDSETSVKLLLEDSKEVLIRKMRKVLSLAEPNDEKLARALEVSGRGLPDPKDKPRALGWGRPDLPDRLKNEVELIQPGEEGE